VADFLTTLQTFESGDRRHPERGGTNIANTTQGTSSGQAQGYNQITTGTWREFGGTAYAPTPLQATREQQNAIAAKIPLGRWAPETLDYLRANGFSVNTKATLADNIAANGGKLGTAPPPHTPTPGTTLNTTTPPGAPGAAPATPAPGATLPGYQPGSPANTMAQNALKQLGGLGASSEQPPQMRLPDAPQAQAVGGSMMMRPGGQNIDGRMAAAQALQQQGFLMQPSLAANTPMASSPVVASQGVASQMPGMATGMPALPGTTLNSPSALQMALMSGSLSPYDMYGRGTS
jgi:Transglycosylase-like domain